MTSAATRAVCCALGLVMSVLLVPSAARAQLTAVPVVNAPAETRLVMLGMKLGSGLPDEVLKGARALETELLRSLRRYARSNVLGWAEVTKRVEGARKAQLLGCDSESCLVELAEFLDADELVTTQLNRVEGVLVVDAVRMRRAGLSVLNRTSMRGRGVTNVLASVDLMARELLGGVQLSLEDPKLGERLGTDDLGVKALRARVAAEPRMGLHRAWTDVLVEHNREPWMLPVLEAGLVLAAGAVAAGSVGVGAYLLVVHRLALAFRYGPIVVNGQEEWHHDNADGRLSYPWFSVVMLVGHALLSVAVTGALVAGAAGVAVWDGMNRGRIKAESRACCRDETRIRDASLPSWPERLAPILALAGGALALASPFSFMNVVTTVLVMATVLPFFILLELQILGDTGMHVNAGTYRALEGVVVVSSIVSMLSGVVVMAAVSLVAAGLLVVRQEGVLVDPSPAPQARPAPGTPEVTPSETPAVP
jgi:hypothetical protein